MHALAVSRGAVRFQKLTSQTKITVACAVQLLTAYQ